MRALLKIVGWGTLAFVVLAVVQERDVFLAAVGLSPPAAAADDAADAQRAAETVRAFLALESHCYGSGGDPRFLERLPATAAVADEIRRDIVYLEHNRRRQVPDLVRLEVVGVERPEAGRAVVRTREYWVVRTEVVGDPAGTASRTSTVVDATYVVVRSGDEWRVAAWEVSAPPPSGPPPQPGGGAGA